jgi:hypothetical protein
MPKKKKYPRPLLNSILDRQNRETHDHDDACGHRTRGSVGIIISAWGGSEFTILIARTHRHSCDMASVLLRFSGAALLLSNTALGFHHNASGAVTPVVASLTSYGSTIDTGVNRDSCATTLWSNNKIVCACKAM